jgi:CheY-like chemotaxis protein
MFCMARNKIMMIEDNASDVFLLRRALIAMPDADFDLEVAVDGERALHLIHSWNGDQEGQREIYPGVILLDLHLPRHDGLEILTAIRKNPRFANTPVLVTTSAVSPNEADELRRMGVDYRLKPRDLAEFGKLAADLVSICNESQAVN